MGGLLKEFFFVYHRSSLGFTQLNAVANRMNDSNSQCADHQDNAQTQAGERGKLANALRDTGVKGIQRACRIAAINTDQNNADTYYAVEAHGCGCSGQNHDKRKDFLSHAECRAANAEQRHQYGDKPKLAPLEPLDQLS